MSLLKGDFPVEILRSMNAVNFFVWYFLILIWSLSLFRIYIRVLLLNKYFEFKEVFRHESIRLKYIGNSKYLFYQPSCQKNKFVYDLNL